MTHEKRSLGEQGGYAETDDYGVLPSVRTSGSLRHRSYVPVEDEDRIVEEDESWDGPYFEVGFSFDVTDQLPGLAELEVGKTYTIGSIDGDPPVYAIIGDKNRKVVEINAQLFDDIVTMDPGEDEEGQDDDAQDGDLGESKEMSEADDRYVGHYRIEGDKTYADTAFMNVIQGAMSGMEMKHLGFGEFELTGDKGTIQFDRMRGKDFKDQVGRSHLVYDDKGGKLVKELIDKLKKAGKIQLSEAVTSEVKMKVPVLFKKKSDKNEKPSSLEVLKGLRESLIGEGCGGKKRKQLRKGKGIKESCGCGISEGASSDKEAIDTLVHKGFSKSDAAKILDVFMENMTDAAKFQKAVQGKFKLPKLANDWRSVHESLYEIFD